MIVDMDEVVNRVALYLTLARVSELRARPFVSDKLFLLAAVSATRGLYPRVAAACRGLILRHNPQHALGHWETMEQALRAEEFNVLLRRLEQQYPAEHAEYLLTRLAVDLPREQAVCGGARRLLSRLLQVPAAELDDCLD
jgi:hypothetical protein